jgi:class 3 adenylate cyclase
MVRLSERVEVLAQFLNGSRRALETTWLGKPANMVGKMTDTKTLRSILVSNSDE